MSFSTNLKNLRELSNLTQDELAQKAGLKKSTISMYERGERFPSEPILEALADIFNVDMNMLLGKQNGTTYYSDPESAMLANEIKSDSSFYNLVSDFRLLNPAGQRKATDYVQDLARITMYRKDAQPEPDASAPDEKEAATSSA